MTQTNQNFEMTQGEDETLSITTKDSTGATTTDISAYTAWTWRVRASENSSTNLIEKTQASGITDNNTDTITITIDKADTESLAPGTYYHELRADTGSAETVIMTGGITILSSITL